MILHSSNAITERGATSIIPPRRNAKIQQHGNCKAPPHPRFGKFASGTRSGTQTLETLLVMLVGVHCLKPRAFASKLFLQVALRRRSFDNQAVELFLQCAALNRMIQLGKPDSYKVED